MTSISSPSFAPWPWPMPYALSILALMSRPRIIGGGTASPRSAGSPCAMAGTLCRVSPTPRTHHHRGALCGAPSLWCGPCAVQAAAARAGVSCACVPYEPGRMGPVGREALLVCGLGALHPFEAARGATVLIAGIGHGAPSQQLSGNALCVHTGAPRKGVTTRRYPSGGCMGTTDHACAGWRPCAGVRCVVCAGRGRSGPLCTMRATIGAGCALVPRLICDVLHRIPTQLGRAPVRRCTTYGLKKRYQVRPPFIRNNIVGRGHGSVRVAQRQVHRHQCRLMCAPYQPRAP